MPRASFVKSSDSPTVLTLLRVSVQNTCIVRLKHLIYVKMNLLDLRVIRFKKQPTSVADEV